MPRKTNGIEFEIHPRPTKGEDGKPLLYVRPAKGMKKSFKQLDDYCTKYCGLRTGQLQQVFDILMETAGRWLSEGYRVETPIGSFAPKLKLLGEHTDPKTITGKDVVYAGLEFIPSKEFVKESGRNREGYRKSKAPVGNSQMYDEKAMDEALRRSLRLGYTTIPDFMVISGLKRDSAKTYLDSLCKGEQPRLRKMLKSRRWLYFPKKPASEE
ncbi:MAG: hypothetical protein IKQ58_04775 [Prevotella sp.]|nr:hypothetical protein [Bacteroidales bacterium]MBR6194765.1 hypothetical protein [Prevotella sp.]